MCNRVIPKDANGDYKRFEDVGESYPDTLEVMNGLIPSHVVFNGKIGALTGDNALHAAQGEKVLSVHSQANRDTRPHLIGGHGDLVWETGKFNNPPERDLETWFSGVGRPALCSTSSFSRTSTLT